MNVIERKKELKLEAFQYKMKLNARSMILHLAKEKIPQEDFLAYMTERMKVKDPKALRSGSLPLAACEICDSEMTLFDVNISPATQTGDPSDKSVWLCPNKKCMNAVYNKKSIKELLVKPRKPSVRQPRYKKELSEKE